MDIARYIQNQGKTLRTIMTITITIITAIKITTVMIIMGMTTTTIMGMATVTEDAHTDTTIIL